MVAIWGFIVAHSALLSGLGVAILDLAFALSPSLAAQGVLHQVYLWLSAKKVPPAA